MIYTYIENDFKKINKEIKIPLNWILNLAIYLCMVGVGVSLLERNYFYQTIFWYLIYIRKYLCYLVMI